MYAKITIRHTFKNIHDPCITEIPSSLNLYLDNGRILNMSWCESTMSELKKPENTFNIEIKDVQFDDMDANGLLNIIKDHIIHAQPAFEYNTYGAFYVTRICFAETISAPNTGIYSGTNCAHQQTTSYTYYCSEKIPTEYPKPVLVCYTDRPNGLTPKDFNKLTSLFDEDTKLTAFNGIETIKTTALIDINNISENSNGDIQTIIHTAYEKIITTFINHPDLTKVIKKDTILALYKSPDQIPDNYRLRLPVKIVNIDDTKIETLTFIIENWKDNDCEIIYTYYCSLEPYRHFTLSQDKRLVNRENINNFIRQITKHHMPYYEEPKSDIFCIG